MPGDAAVTTWTGYLRDREAAYAKRAPRYQRTAQILAAGGLDDRHTVVDVAAGWTELDFCLRTELRWRGCYIPVDGAIDGIELEDWVPSQPAEWFVALEILEHLRDPERLARALLAVATKGVVISTPNPAKVDVLIMDPTHVTPIGQDQLAGWGFEVEPCSLYGVVDHDGLVAWALK